MCPDNSSLLMEWGSHVYGKCLSHFHIAMHLQNSALVPQPTLNGACKEWKLLCFTIDLEIAQCFIVRVCQQARLQS